MLSGQWRDPLVLCGAADSLALNPHKLLFAPLKAGCLLVCDRCTLRRAYSFGSSYLTAADDPLLTDYIEYGPQLSLSFKAFKVWCALRVFGVAAFRAALDHTLGLAQYMADRIQSEPTLGLMAPVTLTAVCLRVTDADDASQARVLADLTSEGTALLGPVTIRGHAGIRACIANYRPPKATSILSLTGCYGCRGYRLASTLQLAT